MDAKTLNKITELIADKVNNEMKLGRFYRFIMPPVILVGEGSTLKLGEEVRRLNVGKILLVTDNDILRLGLTKTTESSLKSAGLEVEIFSDVKSDPTDEMVKKALVIAKDKNIDAVIGLGGGSPLDVAKAVAFMMVNDGDISAYEGVGFIKNGRLPLIAVATTAGTGTEVTQASVITNTQKDKKMVIFDRALVPDIAVVDPRLTVGIPPKVTSATGIDVLAHAIECFCSINSITISNALSHRAIRLTSEHLRMAVGNGDDIVARHRMAVASLIAGIAFSNVGLGACHATAHQVGTTYHVPHGVANAIMLPSVLKYNSLVRPDKMKEIAEAMGENVHEMTDRKAAEIAVRAVRELVEDIGLPSRLKDVGAKESDFDHMAQNALKDPTLASNPRKATLEDIIGIYKSAY